MKARPCTLAVFASTAILCAIMTGPNVVLSDYVPIKPVSGLTGSALLDDWGNRFTTLGTVVGENALRTQVRTTIAQLAMFDAVNAAVDGPYEPFALKSPSPAGASPEAASPSYSC